MKVLGVVLIVIGVFGIVASLLMDTTVEVGGETIGFGAFSHYVPRTRVHNIGLQQNRLIYLLLSSFSVLVGAVLLGFGVMADKADAARRRPAGPRCPDCNGVLEGTPHVCRHCQTQLDLKQAKAPG